MESAWAAAYLAQPMPIGIALLFLIVYTRVVVPARTTPPTLSRRQVAWGYVGIFLACLIASAWLSYVPKEEAESIFKVPPDNYWEAMYHQYVTTAILLSFMALLGSALIGVPILLALSRRALAKIPIVLGISVGISSIFTLLLVLFDIPSPDAQFIPMAIEFVGLHLALTLGFCIGAKLQW